MKAPIDIDWLTAELDILESRFERNAVVAQNLQKDLESDAARVAQLREMVQTRAAEDGEA